MKEKIFHLFIASLIFVSCIDETEIGVTNKATLEATITLSIAENSSATRAMDADDENAIKEIDVLVFHRTSSQSDSDAEFFYRAQTTYAPDQSAIDSSKKDFRVTLQTSGDYQQLVVLANSRALVESLLSTFTGKTRTQVLETLIMTRTTAWNSATGTYDALPMWGQSVSKIITNAASAQGEIRMVRSLAHIDVAVATAAQSSFTLREVWLYNPSTRGLIPGDYTASGVLIPADSELLLPANTGTATEPFKYTTMTDAGKALKGVIYTFEAPASASNIDVTKSFLIVKGSWNKEDDSYYRIDFYDGTDFLPLKRNNFYNISIDEVSGRGYPTPEEAKKAGFSAMTTSLQTWDDGNMGSVVWDGSHMLAVSQTAYVISPVAQTLATLEAATNYSEGWVATLDFDAADGTDWIALNTTPTTGAGDKVARPIVLNLKENTIKNRTATVTVTAGRLQQVITITQNLNEENTLDVGDVEIIFSGQNPQEFSLPIEWVPTANNVEIILIHAGSAEASAYSSLSGYTAGLAFADASLIAGDFGADDITKPGKRAHKILPNSIATLKDFEERRSILKITAYENADKTGNRQTKEVLLRQFDYAITISATGLSFTGDAGTIECQLSTTYSFTIKANAAWKVTSGQINLVTIPVTEGEPNVAGTAFQFTSASISQTVELLFQLKEYPTVSKTVTITHRRNESNCFIVSPGGTVTIPIQKVFEVWASEADLNNDSRGGDSNAMTTGSFSTGLVWQDAQNLISNVSGLTASNENGEFTVTVNNSDIEGNAVVALYEGSTIRWNWHIWVVKDFDPEDNTGYNSYNNVIIMDRNLGAIRSRPESVGDIRTYGLLYQHGRKDPFPGANAAILSEGASGGTANTKPIYDMNGLSTSITFQAVSQERNLANALINPLTFYTNSSTTALDWYTNSTSIYRSDLWGAIKSIFDPCPDGWKVPTEIILNYVGLPANPEEGVGAELFDINGNSVGFYPYPGYRSSAGVFLTVGKRMGGWLSGGGTSGSYYYTTSSSVVSNTGTRKAVGSSVRCVKIQ